MCHPCLRHDTIYRQRKYKKLLVAGTSMAEFNYFGQPFSILMLYWICTLHGLGKDDSVQGVNNYG